MVQLRPLFESPKAVRPAVLLLCLATHALLKVLFFSTFFQVHLAGNVFAKSQGLISPVLLAAGVEWILLVLVVMVLIGNLGLEDIGLNRDHVIPALIVVGVLWMSVQLGAAALVGITDGQLALSATHSWLLPLEAAGERLQAVFGSGLIEEVIYRGFLLSQVYFLFLRKSDSPQIALVAAITFSALYFGVNHIPAGLRMGLSPMDLFGYIGHVTLVGVLFATLFVRTGNLLIAAGAHALLNDPMALIHVPVDPALITLIAVSVLLLGWPMMSRHLGPRFAMATLQGQPAI